MRQHLFRVRDYDLAATLSCGQAFRWQLRDDWWEGAVEGRWVRVRQTEEGILAEAVGEERTINDECRMTNDESHAHQVFVIRHSSFVIPKWQWLGHYLQTDLDLESVLRTFPDDEPMRTAVAACRGLRLLRQEPWECLASFILSSTKQIVQIRQIVEQLCERFGESLPVPAGHAPIFSFPGAARLAECTETELRECKMGFRAPNLLRTARMIAAGEVNLARLHALAVHEARAELLRCPGVGNKIANCALLFGYGFQQAFPVDVWVMKALQQLYFPRRRANMKRLERFTSTHFGPNSGYAQQYLFHYMRSRRR